ncbi:methyltransferase domain-containing protein [Parasphingopyxis lamellibrachiae]|uniref:Ubiquinone/menaquinone biosynthesis C-methylase UbiE n=1 Tax=Parasphingopyxis lamellibrachiae TaxID=680125 RepID=A0A3D9FHI0_9SPHN|nr:methyltransferase domain-containing protein [Parasphingopyxis lamellibrachiae]RED17254.1 ubiquinone/menaquinone biosynthesis C-methylase UbiE [Parasphingopyxis lamellibrachiae]
MTKAKAWSAYWAQMGEAGGCLPGAPPVVEAQLAQLWEEFAQGFAPGSKLLDLACGTGAVMRSLLRGNDRLDLTGVDYAVLPKTRTKKVRLVGETDIAALSFADESFDGLSSQFGVEYSDIGQSAPEMARVAKTGASLRLVVHHAASPIVAQNRSRYAALNAIAQSAILNMARSAVVQPGSSTALLSQAFSLIARNHPDQSVVREIAAGVDNAIRIGGKKGAGELDRIDTNLAQECGVLGALLKVALDEPGIEAFLASLDGAFQCAPPGPIQIRGLAEPIAWLVTGTRNA